MPLFTQTTQSVPTNLLKAKFGWSPFSILNTISWDWQRRKDEWETIFKDSTIGRDTKRYNATPTNTFSARGSEAKEANSISEFDPYLAELMYKWFSRPGDKILDPFSGGCVRGVVASVLGRNYTGIDISEKQIKENRRQYEEITNKYNNISGTAIWELDDAETFSYNNTYNMMFTCPPYYNLERYTKDPRDLSRQPTYTDFLHKYTKILKSAASALVEDSFFVIVVSEIRATPYNIEESYYLGLVPDTIRIIRDECNLRYYNEIILENAIGSLPIRAAKYFKQSRKIGRHHQNILVFYKGNIRNIEQKFENIDTV